MPLDSFDSTFVLGRGNLAGLSEAVGPGAYNADDRATSRSIPSVSFGRGERFLSNRVVHIGPYHNQDLLGTCSPGPKYEQELPQLTFRRPPTTSWGTKPTKEQLERRKKLDNLALTNTDSQIGPANYTVNINYESKHSSPPKVVFPKANRFDSSQGMYALNNSPDSGNGPLLRPILNSVRRAAPSYSFARPRTAQFEAEKENLTAQAMQNTLGGGRTAFMTTSIRGGFARPATLECVISPADYSPKLAPSTSVAFSKSPRFPKAGIEFISYQHARGTVGQASPGPKYSLPEHRNVAQASRTTALKWIP
jgi:hypothetical protein